jgi:hypothetical protein
VMRAIRGKASTLQVWCTADEFRLMLAKVRGNYGGSVY